MTPSALPTTTAIELLHRQLLAGPALPTIAWQADDETRIAARFSGRDARSYERRARLWDAVVARSAERATHHELIGIAATAARPLDVLDLGAGTGRNVTRLDRAGVPVRSYLGIDPSADMVELARRRHRGNPRLTFAPSADLPRREHKAFDLVLLTWVLSQTADADTLLHQALRAVAPGGSLLLTAVTTPANGALARLALARLQGANASRPVPRSLLVARAPARVHVRLGGLFTIARFDHHPLQTD